MTGSVFRWSSISSDPNDARVLAARRRILDDTHQPPVASRNAHLVGLARERTVLDVGVVEHRIESSSSGRWLHRQLAEVATTCVGLDVLPDEVATLRDQGYDVRCHDLSEGPLDEQFDLIIAGEVVEHLNAPVAVLDNARRMVRAGGSVVLTTPNPYMLHRSWQHLRGRHPDSADHGFLLGPGQVLELASRSGLVLASWRGVRLKTLSGVRNRVAATVRTALAASLFAPEVACDSLIYELVPPT